MGRAIARSPRHPTDGSQKNIVADQAKNLIEQARTEETDATTLKAVLKLINTIFIYKFPDRTRQEIEAMLGLSELKQPRVYQDAHQDGEQQGEQKFAFILLTQKFGELAPSLQEQIQHKKSKTTLKGTPPLQNSLSKLAQPILCFSQPSDPSRIWEDIRRSHAKNDA
jgi:hypothetical protein